LAARGFSGKGTAYALGLGESTVSNALAHAAKKLGLRSRSSLIQAAAALFGAKATPLDVSTLSTAERDILDLLRRGLSNAEIASLRSRSTNTVANQVSSILRKTGSPGRRHLFPLA
jgi:DNA-binding CsgD family transcriptional regulator